MKKENVKFISILIALTMILSVIPTVAAGDETSAEPAALEGEVYGAAEDVLYEDAGGAVTEAIPDDGEIPQVSLAEEIPSAEPSGDPNAYLSEPLYIGSVNFRANPKTLSIFKGDGVPNELLWVTFSMELNHDEDFKEDINSYYVDEKYYQLEISRPAHGPSSQHEAKSVLPGNGLAGLIDPSIAGQGGKTHRYHGWKLGDGDFFSEDNSNELKIGDYTATLYRYTGEGKPSSKDWSSGSDKTTVNSKDLTIVDVTYKLSQTDSGKGYKLKSTDGSQNGESVNELAMVGDVLGAIDPELDATEVAADPAASAEPQNVIISGWKVVKDGNTVSEETVGDVVPEDKNEGTNASQDGTEDNKITLEAVLSEPKDYSYDVTEDKDNGESILPAEPSAEPGATAAPVSYNKLLAGGGADKTLEYEPQATIEPLKLRLVNTGNQRIHVVFPKQDDLFTVVLNDMNANDEAAKKPYGEGGLDSGQSYWYIPSKKDTETHGTWKNYAEMIITPKKGIETGTHVGTIAMFNQTDSSRVFKTFGLEIKIDKKTVKIAPHNVTKEYGQTLTPADIECDVYDSEGTEILLENVTAAEIGVVVQSEGLAEDAAVKAESGEYPYTGVTAEDAGNTNYTVSLKNDINTGITVNKTTPIVSGSVTASGVNTGDKLSASKLSGTFINKNSGKTVEGNLEWANKDDTVTGTSGSQVMKEYKFTPSDDVNYIAPDPAMVAVVISDKKPTNLRVINTEKVYNGEPQTPTFKWDRPTGPREDQLNVVYKKVTPDDTAFAEDEDFTVKEGGYSDSTPKDAGTYKVHADTAKNLNYDIFGPGTVNAIMTIKPATLGISLAGTGAIDKIYDGSANVIVDVDQIKYTKKKEADDVKVISGALVGTFKSASVDRFYPKTATINVITKEQFTEANSEVEIPETYPLTGPAAANYTLSSDPIHASGKITPRQIKLQLTDGKKEKEYGDTLTLSASDCEPAPAQAPNGGLAPGDNVESLKLEFSVAQNANEKDGKVGSYAVTVKTPENVTDSNYDIEEGEIGTLIVNKGMPQAISVSAGNGHVKDPLSSLNLTGTFENKYTHEKINGTLDWKDPAEELSKDKSEYEWTFTPSGSDLENYDIANGHVTITVTDKTPAPITEFNVPEEITYDGESHPVTIKTSATSARTSVEYKKLDIAPYEAEPEIADEWSQTPPKDAGTYDVRGTVYGNETYAENSITKTMVITQAEPKGGVTASSVNKGGTLSQSQLTAAFTGVKNETLTGTALWQNVGDADPSMVILEGDGTYSWIFVPEDSNYKTVTGEAEVKIIPNERAPEVVDVYNLPPSVPGGDYAYVTVDGVNLKAGDVVTFYHDSKMANPLSSAFTITEEMDGPVKITLDNELNPNGGTIYVNIKDSIAVQPVDYKPQVGFTLKPEDVNLDLVTTKSQDITIESSDYEIENATWTSDNEGVATVSGNAEKGTVTAVSPGDAGINVEVTFTHPDGNLRGEKITLNGTARVTVTETKQEPHTYKYTTEKESGVTESEATLNGSVNITLSENSSLTPYAAGKFELWEGDAAAEEKAQKKTYDSGSVFSESGDHSYSLTVTDLKPGTDYSYRAVGSDEGWEPGGVVTFKTEGEPLPSATPKPSETPSTPAPTTGPVTPTETPLPTLAPTTAPTATPTTPTAAPTATPGTKPTATPTTAPTATPGTKPTATPTAAPTATPETKPTATPTTAPTATPGTAPTATPETTPTAPPVGPTPTAGTTPTATPTTGPTATPTADALVNYSVKPALNGSNITATVTNKSEGKVLFIAAAYRGDILIDIQVVEVPKGEKTINESFDADYTKAEDVNVKFFLWDAATLAPHGDAIDYTK